VQNVALKLQVPQHPDFGMNALLYQLSVSTGVRAKNLEVAAFDLWREARQSCAVLILKVTFPMEVGKNQQWRPPCPENPAPPSRGAVPGCKPCDIRDSSWINCALTRTSGGRSILPEPQVSKPIMSGSLNQFSPLKMIS